MKSIVESTPGLHDLLQEVRNIRCGKAETLGVIPLCGDGSDRKFYRITSGQVSFIGLLSPRSKSHSIDENDSYLAIGNHLYRKGIPVPRIIFADTQLGRFLLEDAGDLHLQTFARSRRSSLKKIYGHVLALLTGLHGKARDGFSTDFCFDTSLYDPAFVYERELEYFRKAFLNGYLGLEIDADALRPDFEQLAETAGAAREGALVFHRDFQSRNIMVKQNRLWLLDFQGMRFGPPEYDLASLLLDPYVRLPGELQDELFHMYWSGAGRFLGYTRGEFLKKYEAVRLCRNLQILGAFGFLGTVKGKRHFLDYVPWAWEQLLQHLRGSCRGRFARIERLIACTDPLRLPSTGK